VSDDARPRPIGAIKTLAAFRDRVDALGIALHCDDQIAIGREAPLAQSYTLRDGKTVGNRFCIHPMEGWDGTADGLPTELTHRRWRRFGESGAKLIWGGEAVAVSHDGRASPNQLVIDRRTVHALRALREDLVMAHQTRCGPADDLLVGLQLTHSGRYARPRRADRPEPRLVQRHPLLDARLGPEAAGVNPLDDAELASLAETFVDASLLAADAGFAFVDIKHCHGYLAHDLLGAHTRPGSFGGSLENRTRFLRRIVDGIRRGAPQLGIGVRLSAFDLVPYRRGSDGRGQPEAVQLPYSYGFGVRAQVPTEPDLTEPILFMRMLRELGIELCNLTAGSPYYNPHVQRPALYPPSDGYDPPEDPLIGVARQIGVAMELKRAVPELFVVGSAYSYLQQFLPHVAQRVIRDGGADAVGIGRLALSYPGFPSDVLAGRSLDQRLLCRTFSDCTTGPRNGLVSGCYPLDPFYKERPEAARIMALRPRSRRH